MTRMLRALLILLIPPCLSAQIAPVVNPFPQGFSASFRPVLSGDHTTATCTPGQTPILIDGGTYYGCTATNTWTAFSAGSGCSVGGSAGQIVINNGSSGCASSVDWVITTASHTLAGGASAVFDQHLMGTTAFKVPGGFTTGVLHVTTTTGATAGGLVVTADITDANVTLAKLATQTANTVLGNYPGGTASPTAGAAPSGGTNGCSGTSDAASLTAGTGWGCHLIIGGSGSSVFTGSTATNPAPSPPPQHSHLPMYPLNRLSASNLAPSLPTLRP